MLVETPPHQYLAPAPCGRPCAAWSAGDGNLPGEASSDLRGPSSPRGIAHQQTQPQISHVPDSACRRSAPDIVQVSGVLILFVEVIYRVFSLCTGKTGNLQGCFRYLPDPHLS